MDPETRLEVLGIELPEAPSPVAAYVPAVRAGNLLHVSGQIPVKNGQVIWEGTVPNEVSQKEAHEAARLCAINGLAVAKAELGSLMRVKRVVRLEGFVACDANFTQHPKVINGASELMQEVFGDIGQHSRFAVGAPSLPLDVPVEIGFIFEVEVGQE